METLHGGKAILVVSVGISYPEIRKKTIEAVENKIRAEFSDYTVRRAFISHMIIKKIMREEKRVFDTPEQALEKLKAEGCNNVVVQPLHIIAGQEYDELKKVVDYYVMQNSFANIILGKPVLYSQGENGSEYEAAVEALQQQLPRLKTDEAVVLMGHGALNAANIIYFNLQAKLNEAGIRAYVGTAKASPSLTDIKRLLQENKIKRVILMPYMLVAGDHAQNELAGDEDDAWKVQLRKAGYQVDVYMHGLGENPAYQNIYVRHIKAALRQCKV